MGQTNAVRVQFDPRQIITSAVASARQELAFTGYYRLGDTANIEARDARGNKLSTLASNLSISFIEDNVAIVFGTSVDTSTALPAGAVGYFVVANPIDDAQSAIDRLYRSSAGVFQVSQPIVSSTHNTPVGKLTLTVDDVNLFRVGDASDVVSDEGVQISSTIFSIAINADEANNKSQIVLSSTVDLSGATNPRLVTTATTTKDVVDRLRQNVDTIDQPIENEFLGAGNGSQTAFEAAALFLSGSSKLLLDGRRQRLGTTGTRASLTLGTGNGALTVTSMILGLAGNAVDFEVLSAAGTTVTVTGNFEDGTLKVSINNNSDAATAADLAAALNASADAKKILQAVYGGTGANAVAAAAAAPLTGGLDNGTGDYAELAQVVNNAISLTGYKWLSLHVRPEESNRLSSPPRDSEELVVDYRKALTNA